MHVKQSNHLSLKLPQTLTRTLPSAVARTQGLVRCNRNEGIASKKILDDVYLIYHR